MKKKILSTLLGAAMLISLAACGFGTTASTSGSQSAGEPAATVETPATEAGSKDAITSETVEEESETEEIEEAATASSIDDMYGSYNGVPFSVDGTSWADTFGADGWVRDEEWSPSDRAATTFWYTNDKYPDAYLSVDSMEEMLPSEMENSVFYGYGIDVSAIAESGSSAFPNMTWNGITFGSSVSDLVSAYGEMTDGDERDGYTWCCYTLSDYADFQFEFSPYTNGLIVVETMFSN